MPVGPETPETPAATPASEPIADRLRLRLQSAGLAFDRRHKASRPRSGGRARSSLAGLGAAGSAPPMTREQAELRTVFRELGEAHRQYRVRTGQAGSTALREAAHAFKREPSLASLTSVATHIDELGLLGW